MYVSVFIFVSFHPACQCSFWSLQCGSICLGAGVDACQCDPCITPKPLHKGSIKCCIISRASNSTDWLYCQRGSKPFISLFNHMETIYLDKAVSDFSVQLTQYNKTIKSATCEYVVDDAYWAWRNQHNSLTWRITGESACACVYYCRPVVLHACASACFFIV